MMKTFRAFAVSCTLLCATVPVSAQAVNNTQRLTLAGLRSSGGRGGFPAAAYGLDGSLFLLYDQGDGVRVLKINSAGDAVLAQAQLGAAGDAPLAMAIDPAGNVYVTGTAASGSLSGTSGAAFPNRADTSTNSFLAKFDSSLNTIFVTFLGAGRTAAASVAATADAVFVTGITFNTAFPVTSDGIQQAPASGSTENGFVERINANGTALVYATYLTGTNGTTAPNAIAADSADSAYIVGSTSSSAFPTIAALVPRTGGTNSGFLTKLTPAGDGFVFSTFVPGGGLTGIALDEPAQTLLLSGNVSLGQFPVALAPTPLTSASYQSLLRIAADGQSVGTSTVIVPGSQSSVAKGANDSAWITGSLTTPLFSGSSQPLASFGDSFAIHVTSTGVIDQTARFGGQPAGSFAAGSLASAAGRPAVSGDGSTIAVPGTLTAAVDATAANSVRFDLPLVRAPNQALPSVLRDLAPSCSGAGQCSTTAGYLSTLSTVDGVSLSISADSLPSLVVRNLGTETATGLALTASGYTISSNCGATLPPSNACAAALTGAGPGSFTVSAANLASQTIALPANASAPDALAVLPVALDFGIQTETSPATLRTLTVTNLSPTTQTFASTFDSTARSLPYSFSEVASDCGTNGLGAKLLASGSSCHITLGFSVTASAVSDTDVRGAWKVGTHDIALTGYAQVASLSVSSSVVDFGTYLANGVRLPRYLYLSNNSVASIPHVAVSLPQDSPFALLDECPSVLEPQSVCRFTLTYSAVSAPSVDSRTLTLDQEIAVLITGTTLPQTAATASSANPSLTISPASVSFASPVLVSGVSAVTQVVSVKNTAATSTAVSVTVTGDFNVQNACPSSLAAGSSCQILVSFAPSQPGQRQGLLAVSGGSGFAPAYLALSGTSPGILPANNGVLDVGRTLVGEPVVVWYKLQQSLTSVTITSHSAPFGVALVEDDGAGHGTLPAGAFAQSVHGSCGNCYFGIQFLSQTTGMQSASLTFATSAQGNAYSVTAVGTALPASGLLLTPISQVYTPVPINSSAVPQLFTLANLLPTASSVNITSVTATGDFSIAPNTSGGAACSGSLASTASCFVQVLFAPTARGQRTGTLTIVTSGGSASATLNGFGEIDPGVALNPVELDFNSVPGTSATQQSVVVSNSGSAPLMIGPVTASDLSFVASSKCDSLAPGASCSISITFMPGFAQTAATLSIPVTKTINGQTNMATYAVALQGLYTTQNAGLELVPGQVNFGTVAVGSAGQTRQFTLNNLTAKPVDIALSLPRQFPLAGKSACTTLSGYGSCTFSVVYVPAAAGTATGTLFAQGVSRDGSAPLQTLAYTQGFATGTAALTISGSLIPNSPLMFGQVSSGQRAQQTLTLTNPGTTPLTVRRVTSQPPFLSTTTCGGGLAGGQSCSISVTYAPSNEIAAASPSTAARADTGTLTIESDAATSPDVIELAGMAAPMAVPALTSTGTLNTFTLSQGALTFANVAVGNASDPQTITLTNSGNVPLHVLGLAASTDFTVASGCGTLLPGANCTFTVNFAPTAVSTLTVRTGALEIRTDASVSLEFVTLIGSSSAAPLTLSPMALDFGTVNVGSSGTLSTSVWNTSSTPVIFTGVSASGEYTVSNGTCPSGGSSLAAGSGCMLQVTFTPTVSGTRNGTLSLTTDSTTLPLTVSLTGNGVIAKLQATPGALAFGSIAVGAPANLSLTLLNAGTAGLSGISAALTGRNAGDFAVTVPCSTTSLAPNQGCSVTVTFTPSAVGPRSATLTIVSNDPASPIVVSLTGSGTAPGSFTLTVDGATSALRTVSTGSPAAYTLTLTPLNGFAGSVALTCSPIKPGAYASCSLNPSTVTLNGNAQTSVVTINTITSASNAPHTVATVFLAWAWLPLFCARRKRGRRPGSMALLFVSPLAGLALGALITGCGGGGSAGNGALRYTPAGMYQYTITGTSNSGVQVTQTVTLNLTVQ